MNRSSTPKDQLSNFLMVFPSKRNKKTPFDLQQSNNNSNNNNTHVFVLVSGELWIDGPFLSTLNWN